MRQLVAADAQLRAVQPEQERCLRLDQPDFRHLLRQIRPDKIHVLFQIRQQLLDIVLALRIPGDKCRNRKNILLDAAVHFELLVHQRPQLRIGNHNCRAAQTGAVEGFRRGKARDDIAAHFLRAERAHRNMLVPVEHQVRMNLIADHNDMVPGADLGHPVELVFRPDPADRIVRIADDHQLCFGVRRAALKIVKVDRVSAVFIDQAVVAQLPCVVVDGVAERMVDRAGDNNPVTRLRQCLHHGVEDRNNTGGKHNPVFLELPAVPLFDPPHDCGRKIFRDKGVAVNRVLRAPHHRLHHRRGAGKIRVCGPHRKRIGVSNPGADIVPFGRAGMIPVDHFIKIILHVSSPSMPCPFSVQCSL